MSALTKLTKRLTYANVMSTIAAFAVLAGGTAYAADTIGSSDIIDGEVKSADVGDGEIGSADVKDNSINTFDVHSFLGVDVADGTLTGDDVGDGTLTGFDIKDGFIGQVDLADGAVNSAKVADGSLTNADIKNQSLGNGDFLTGSVDSRVATDNSLTGADINESTLNLAPVSTTTFASMQGPKAVTTQVPILEKTVPDGSWAVTATVNSSLGTESHSGAVTRDVVCSLRDGGQHFLGGATDRRTAPGGQTAKRTLTMTGGFQSDATGHTVFVWCASPQGTEIIDSASMMLIRVGGFS